MDREPTTEEAKHFADEFRASRGTVLRDAEDFDQILHSVERLGSFLFGKVDSLGGYGPLISEQAFRSPLATEIPEQLPEFHVPFERLYELVKDAQTTQCTRGRALEDSPSIQFSFH